MIILVVSDDHGMDGFKRAFDIAVSKYGQVDMVLHAGDVGGHDIQYYNSICQCPVYLVRGNNDYNNVPYERVVEACGKRIYLTHGHHLNVYMGCQRLVYTALNSGADIAVYGHTHIPECITAEDLVVMNPGSLALPRRGKYGTFAIIEIENDNINVSHITMN